MSLAARTNRLIVERENLSIPELLGIFRSDDVEAKTFEAALQIFEQEYGIPVGCLRPEDDLGVFVTPSTTKSPLGWLFDEAAIEDKASELEFHLDKRRVQLGLARVRIRSGMTVGRYVDAWLGNSDTLTEPR